MEEITIFNLSPITTENLITLIGIFCTVITIIISIYNAKVELRDALLQQKNENILKRIDELPLLLNDFINSNIDLIIHTYVKPDEKKRMEATKIFDDTLPKLQNILIMYGSIHANKIFYELKLFLVAVANGQEAKLADLFALLVLLCAQIRHDLTSAPIDLRYYIDLLIPQAQYHKEDIYVSIKKYISAMELEIEISK